MFIDSKYCSQILLFALAVISCLSYNSCSHDPVFSGEQIDPMDNNTEPLDTMIVDSEIIGEECDPEVVYFNQNVLPILVSNCAFSGCHNADSAKDGVVLDSYINVLRTGDIELFDPKESDLYEVLLEDDLDKRMPPPPAAPLTETQINIIATWIIQGAEDLECNPNIGGCNTGDVSFVNYVQPLLETHCQGCHSGVTPAGGIDLASHSSVETYAINGKLYGSIAHRSGFEAMPRGGEKLDDCSIDKISSWIDAGALNN